MSNRETYPAAQSPLTGDLSGAAGQTTVTVVGLQTIPIDPTPPTAEETLIFDAHLGLQGQWTPRLDANVSVTIGEFLTAGGEIISRGRKLSDDYDFLVNCVGLDVLVGWSHGFAFQVFVNGTGVV
jgi:hypothetical protein